MLSKTNRLTKTKDIDYVFKTGKSFFSNNIGIKATPNKLELNRITVIVSSKVSKRAVVRNKIKRRLRYIIRLELAKLSLGKDIIFLALPSITKVDFRSIKTEVENGLKRLKLYQ